MRDFFKQILDRTYENFGVRQTDEEKMSEADVVYLLDRLCNVSKIYAYIPEEEQKKIIDACMIKDRTYRNINVRLIAGWLEDNGKIFFTQKHHEENKDNPDYKPLEGDERDRAIQTYLDTLAKVQTNWTSEAVKGSGSKLRENLDQNGVKFDPEKHEEFKHAVKSFFIDGFEIYAKSLEEAEKIYNENFVPNASEEKQTADQESDSQGTGENPETENSKADPTEQRKDL